MSFPVKICLILESSDPESHSGPECAKDLFSVKMPISRLAMPKKI